MRPRRYPRPSGLLPVAEAEEVEEELEEEPEEYDEEVEGEEFADEEEPAIPWMWIGAGAVALGGLWAVMRQRPKGRGTTARPPRSLTGPTAPARAAA